MPTNQVKVIRSPYQPSPDADARRVSAIRLAQAILAAPEVVPSHRRELLSIAVWKYTEADAGKWGLRYRSTAVLRGPTASVQHEHVLPRKYLVERMLNEPDHVPEILATAQACLVTTTEHTRLSALPASVLGWSRYLQAGIEVTDMLTGEPADLIQLAEDAPADPIHPARLGGE